MCEIFERVSKVHFHWPNELGIVREIGISSLTRELFSN